MRTHLSHHVPADTAPTGNAVFGLQPRTPSSVSSRNALRKGLGLDRLLAKVNKPAGTPTLELWVLYQQLKLEATTSGQQHNAQLVESQPLSAAAQPQVHKFQREDANGLSVQHSQQVPIQQPVHSGTAISLSDDSVRSTPHTSARRIQGVAQLSGSRVSHRGEAHLISIFA